MDRLRIDRWDNSKTSPSDLSNADGQTMKMVHTPPTKWSCSFSHPLIHEVFHIEHFTSLTERKEYIARIKRELDI